MDWIDIGFVGGLVVWYVAMIAAATMVACLSMRRFEGGTNGGEPNSP